MSSIAPSRAARYPARYPWRLALAGLCALLLAPLLIVDVPPLGDYPNHLARAFVLASLPGDAVLGRMFAPRWALLPNLGIDILAPPLMALLPVHAAGRVVIALAMLTPVLGAVAYGRALGGRWWPLCAGLAAWNCCLLDGFVNFSLALGPPLLAAAAWLRWRAERPGRVIALAAAVAALTFFLHLMGVVFMVALLGGAELARPGLLRWRALAGRGGGLALVFAAPALLYHHSALGQLGGDAVWSSPAKKLEQLADVFATFDPVLDTLAALVAVGVPLLCLLTGRGRVPLAAAFPAAGFLVAYVAAPFAWKGTFLLDTRLAVMLLFTLFAGFVPRAWPRAAVAAVATAVCGLFAARMALLAAAWTTHAASLADLRTAMAPVRPGQAVFTATVELSDAPAYWAADARRLKLSGGVRADEHMGALLVIERRAYWPFQFDIPSQQPIETLPPYAALASGAGSPAKTRRELLGADLCGYESLLLLDADAVPPLPADRFVALAVTPFAALYRIDLCRPAQRVSRQ
jgi:hypothetical protein